MGKTATFARSRHNEARDKRDQRSKRAKDLRDKRLGVDNADRKLQRVVLHRELPSDADAKLLSTQFTQACRLPAPSADLCRLIRHYAGTPESETATEEPSRGNKRARDSDDANPKKVAANPTALNAMADVFVSSVSAPVMGGDLSGGAADGEDDDEDPMTVILAILQNEHGRRVVSTLLGALHQTKGCAVKCLEMARAVLEQFEENEHLAKHHIACRVLSALVLYGPREVRQGVLSLLRQSCMDQEGVRALLSDRHTSVTVENLLKMEPEATSQWLCESLGLSSVVGAAAPSSSSPKKKGVKASKKAVQEDSEASLSEADLVKLIEDSVSGQVIKQLINSTTRPLLLGRLNVATLLESKRGMSFLTALLDVPAAETQAGKSADAAAFASTLDALLEQTASKFDDLAVDRQANFVVQKLFLLVPHTPTKKQVEYFTRIAHLLGDAAGLQALLENPFGVHVVCTLVDAIQQSEAAATTIEEIGSLMVTKRNITDLVGSRRGSLVVRRLMPLVKKGASSKVGHLITSAIEQNLSSLLYDASGNLVVQAYLKELGQSEASAFARKFKKEELVAMSRNQFAAYVVSTLLDVVDATTHVVLCNLLKPYVATLAMHLNGRFVVEKLIPASRDVRDELVRQFSALAMEQGTQHVLCALVAHLDPRGKQNMIDNVITPSIRDLAMNSYGSVSLQKLMQNDADVLAAVQNRLRKDTALSNELVRNFHGKFVVNNALNPRSS